MMPLVDRHEDEVAAVPRVVVTVRTPLERLDAGTAVGARPGIHVANARVALAREVHRHGNRHQLRSIHRTEPWRVADDHLILQARVRRDETGGNQRLARYRALAGFVIEVGGFGGRRTDVGNRRQIVGGRAPLPARL